MTTNQTSTLKSNQPDRGAASETRIAAAVEAAYVLEAVRR
jgi:hypothetical protein